MSKSIIKNPRKIHSHVSEGDSTIDPRVTNLENNEYKITYFTEISSSTGTIIIPTGATILLDQLQSGEDAYVSTIQNGQPTGDFPQTGGGATVDVTSFDALGNYTLSGIPNSYPVALIYILKIKAKDYSNLDIDHILDLEGIGLATEADLNIEINNRLNADTTLQSQINNLVIDSIADGDTTHAPSRNSVFDGLALKITGPLTATDNAIVRYDGTSGKLSKDSTITISDNGAIVFPPLTGQTYLRGLLQYDSDNESLSFYNNEADIFMQIGQEIWMRCRNVSGSTITNGQAVYVNGSSSGLPTIALANGNSATTTVCAGLTTHAIENNTIGYVTVLGTVRGLDTSLLSVGNVFLSATVAGGLTNTSPVSPNYRYRIGFVTSVNASTGTIQVTPTTAALGNGTANQILGINSAGTAQEFKSSTGTGNVILSSAVKLGIPLFHAGGLNPADSTSYYIGLSGATIGTTAASVGFNIGQGAMKLTGAMFSISGNSVAGSAEAVPMQLRNITQATSSNIGNITTNGGSTTVAVNFTFSGLSINVASGDTICLQMNAPAYATNPTGLFIRGVLFFENQ